MAPEKKAKRKHTRSLKELYPHAAGMDIGSREHWVCCPPDAQGTARVRSFRTTTPGLDELIEWLQICEIKSIAMESTGVYWIPVYERLEQAGFEVLLVNARQLKGVPGRKSDVLDCQWIQKLHACGLLRGSFRPHESICALRAVVREQGNLVAERSRWLQRMQKSLDQMNVRVHHAVSDISGVTGMRIIRAILDGERDPNKLAALRARNCRKSEREIAEHLTGNWREEHLFNLRSAVDMYDQIQRMIARYEQQVIALLERLQEPGVEGPPADLRHSKKMSMRKRGQTGLHKALYSLSGVDLCLIDGISVETTVIVWSEMGTDWSSFTNEKHFVSYAKLSPRLAMSGGKPIRGRGRGSASTRLNKALRMAAVTLRHSKTALGADYRRIARTKGANVAVFAIARKLAVLIFRMVRHGYTYVDIGEKAREKQFQEKRIAGLKRAAKELGLAMTPA